MSNGDFLLLVGLGNPGYKYNSTRHNIGFMALERLARKESTDFHFNKKLSGQIAEIGIGVKKKRLLMPETFMNESGKSVKAVMNWFDIQPHQILIIVDDIDLPLGKLRIRSKGSAGGHNGLKSIIQYLGTQNFSRLRVGIGNPAQNSNNRRSSTVKHVLGSFNPKETEIINYVLDEVLEGLGLIEKLGIEKATNHLNSIKPDFEKNK